MYNATLVNGLVYILAGRRFEEGKTVKVDEATKVHLETYAVDNAQIGDSGRVVKVQKFEFTPVGAVSAPAPVVTPAPSVSDDDTDDSAPAAAVVSGRPKAR